MNITQKVLDVCNEALGLIGQNREITTIDIDTKGAAIAQDEKTPENVACSKFFTNALELCLSQYNWSFARFDELLTKDDIVDDDEHQPLPYKYYYRLPKNVLKVLLLTNDLHNIDNENVATNAGLQFNFRNFNNTIYLVTNAEPPLSLQYIGNIETLEVCSCQFIEAFIYLLASKLARSLIKGTDGVGIANDLANQAMMRLQIAARLDAQQGAPAITKIKSVSFLDARK